MPVGKRGVVQAGPAVGGLPIEKQEPPGLVFIWGQRVEAGGPQLRCAEKLRGQENEKTFHRG